MTFISKRERDSKQYPVIISAVLRFKYSVISMDTDDRPSDSGSLLLDGVVATHIFEVLYSGNFVTNY